MCGILGSVNIIIDSGTLNTLSHRGPDDFGIESYLVATNSVQLAHRRLSIIDLSSAGHQPMNTFCNDYSIIFNGEIYNHLELRAKLPSNIPFKGHSDTETLLYYLKEKGIEGVKDANGIFSFAFLDKRSKRLFLARDPFGVKPLYYLKEVDKLIFASEIRPLLTVSKTTLDKDALATLLRLRYNASPWTLHKEVRKLIPGHYVEIDLGNKKLNFANKAFLRHLPKTINLGLDDAVNQYGRVLEDAINRQLLSDVEVGVMLSGGVDSALVASIAQKNYSGKLKAFTIGFEGNYSEDEIENAAETAHYLGLDHHYKKISFDDFLGTIRECVRIVEEPLATTSLIPMYFLSQLTSKHVKVVLTGQGADEPLGGYGKYKLELIRGMVPKFIRKSALPFVKISQIKKERFLRGSRALGIENELQRFLAVYEIFSAQEIEELIGVKDKLSLKALSYFYHELRCDIKDRGVERMMALDTRLNLPDDLLNYTDKITMHFSIECRVPMLDIELVDFIESLPQKLKLNVTGGKLIHKKFATHVLPQNIINRKKLGFQSPTKKWFRSENETVRRILLTKGTYFSEVFDRQIVEQILKQHQAGYNREKQIFLLLSLFFWCEERAGERPAVVKKT
jgi:asparagine synthase (glutamine-hydrolysing)